MPAGKGIVRGAINAVSIYLSTWQVCRPWATFIGKFSPFKTKWVCRPSSVYTSGVVIHLSHQRGQAVTWSGTGVLRSYRPSSLMRLPGHVDTVTRRVIFINTTTAVTSALITLVKTDCFIIINAC